MRPSSSLPYNPALDGLRAVALIGILLFHSDFDWARGGFLGVSAFFTLSGFLITRLLLAEWGDAGRIHLRAFWVRRFRRLMPAALLGLLGVGIFSATLSRSDGLGPLAGDVLAALFYVSNWRFILEGHDYAAIFREPSPVQHFWSLGIEEQFYLVHPVLLLLLLRARRGSRRLLGALLAAAALVSCAVMAWLYVPGEIAARPYYGTDTRAAEFLVGALLALWLPSDEAWSRVRGSALASLLGVVALGGELWLWTAADLDSAWLYRGGFMLHACLSALVLAGASRPGPLWSVLSLAPLRAVGRISYGLYVYHWPIFLWLDPDRTGLAAVPLFALRLALTGLVAVLSYRFVEEPIRRGGRLQGRRGQLAALAGAAAVAALMAGVVSLRGVEEADYSDRLEDVARTEASRSSLPRVMIVGDSIAFSVSRGLRQWSVDTGEALVWDRTRAGCGIARGGQVKLSAGARQARADGCWKVAEQWPQSLEQLQPDIVVVASGGFDLVDRKLPHWSQALGPGDATFDDWLLGEYQRAVDVLSSSGARVVWLTWPCAKDQPYHGRLKDTNALDIARVRQLNEAVLVRLAASRPERVRILDLFSRVCPDKEFTHELGSFENARRDGLHFGKQESRWLADWLAPRILEAGGQK